MVTLAKHPYPGGGRDLAADPDTKVRSPNIFLGRSRLAGIDEAIEEVKA